MAEIYLNDIETDTLTIPSGTMTSVTVTASLNDAIPTPLTPTGTGTSKSVEIPLTLTNKPGRIVIKWTYTVSTTELTKESIYEIVIPYAPFEDIAELSGKTLPADKEIVYRAETLARKVIEAYTGKFFGQHYAEYMRRGESDDCLLLPEHPIEVTHVSYDRRGTPIYPINVVVPTTPEPPGSTILPYVDYVEAGDYGIQIYDVNYDVDKTIVPWVYTEQEEDVEFQHFHNKWRYTVRGVFGYETVPQDVVEATLMLATFYLCTQAGWWTKFIESNKFGESQIRFNRAAWEGTGNAAVDLLLNPYRFDSFIAI